jgi:hypothetical protein
MPQVIAKLSLVLHFRFEQQKIFKKIDLYQLFYFDKFLPLFVFASRSLSFLVLLITETVAYALMGVILELKTEPKE